MRYELKYVSCQRPHRHVAGILSPRSTSVTCESLPSVTCESLPSVTCEKLPSVTCERLSPMRSDLQSWLLEMSLYLVKCEL